MDDQPSNPRRKGSSLVALCRVSPIRYPALPPFDPSESYPELVGDPTYGSEKNDVYRAVRDVLSVLKLDKMNLGTSRWNPLRDLVEEGGSLVIKPNLVSEPRIRTVSSESITTHGSVIRPLIDYGLKAVGDDGEVIVADAPQFDSNFDEIVRLNGLSKTINILSERHGRKIQLLDLRAECVKIEDGVVTGRIQREGDPRGYTLVDLGEMSMLQELQGESGRFRGSDYDRSATVSHHLNGKHEYSISNTVLTSDCIINVPKLKTHEKAGVTLNLKNFVGINGHKNLIPHYRMGHSGIGGDEMSVASAKTRALSKVYDLAQSILPRAGHIGTRFMRILRSVDERLLTDNPGFQRAGAWWGNDTLWRCILDLSFIAHMAGEGGVISDHRVRTLFSVVDGVVAGEGNGPHAPTARYEGVVVGGGDLIAVDLVAISLMGYDSGQFRSYSRLSNSPLGSISSTDVEPIEVLSPGQSPRTINQVKNDVTLPFELADGWKEATKSVHAMSHRIHGVGPGPIPQHHGEHQGRELQARKRAGAPDPPPTKDIGKIE
jgi:uncharacterized protein (DUF362 family)